MTLSASPHPFSDKAGHLAEQAALGTDHAIKSTQRATNHALDRLSDAVQQAPTAIHDRAASAEDLAQRGAAALREHTLAASARARSVIEHDPVKSVVIAAAVGAGVTALWLWLSHRHATR
jgi:ElaB/YqjD/DUF883 family membrane-anchored ribosome-binding protein